jgi:hypothetical protein
MFSQGTASGSVTRTVNVSPTITVNPSFTTYCPGGTAINLTANSPTGVSYSWTPTTNMTPSAGNTATVAVQPTASRKYTATTTDNNGCTASADALIMFPVLQL